MKCKMQFLSFFTDKSEFYTSIINVEKLRKMKNIVLNAKNTIYITFQISCIHVRAKSKLFTFTDKINT